MKKNTGWVIIVIVLSLMLVISMVFGAVGMLIASAPKTSDTGNTNTARAMFTPDPCSPDVIPEQVARVNAFTREFEDTAQILTSTLLRDTSAPLVQDLQRIRRNAEDQVVPSCLADLKQYQIAHMNARIDVFGTALMFLNTYGPNGDQNTLNQLLSPLYAKAEVAARQYENEYGRLLGFTPAPPLPAATIETPAP